MHHYATWSPHFLFINRANILLTWTLFFWFQGLRKPAEEAYQVAVKELSVPASEWSLHRGLE